MATGGALLLVEDDDSIGRLVKQYLEQQDGWRVLWRRTGEEAIAELRGQPVRFVVLDIGLPGMDGFQVAQEIHRRLPDAVPRLVAVTGYGQDRDREKSRAAGFHEHLVKPASFDAIRQVLSEGRMAPVPAG